MFPARAAAVIGTVGLLALSGACAKGPGSGQNAGPEEQSATVQPATEAPITVSGCLRGGAVENSFVLTSVQQQGTVGTATYQLEGKPGVDFRDHMGQQVRVTGTLGTETDVDARGPVAAEPKAKGTTGTPAVQTDTDLQVRTLHVDSLTPSGSSCRQ